MSYRFYYREAFLAIIAQSVTLLIIIPLIWLAWHLKEASSFALGGCICFLPNVCFYRQTFKHFGPQAAKQIVKAFYRGEMLKSVLTAAGFFIALRLTQILPIWLFAGYMAAQGGFWLGPLLSEYLKCKA